MKVRYHYPVFVFNGSDFIEYGSFVYEECLNVIDDLKSNGYVCYLYKGSWFCVMGY